MGPSFDPESGRRMTASGRANQMGLPALSMEEESPRHHISAPKRLLGDIPVNIHQFQLSETSRDAGGKGLLSVAPQTVEALSSTTHATRISCICPRPCSLQGPGQREHSPSNDPCPRCRGGNLVLAQAVSPQMLDSLPIPRQTTRA